MYLTIDQNIQMINCVNGYNEYILPESAKGFYEAGDKDLAYCMIAKQNPKKLWKRVY